MVEFLIDVNLPRKFRFWSGKQFIHVFDLNDEWSDSQIWEYAKTHNLTIITKDADFSERIIAVEPPPKVIHFRIGNMRIREFHDFISKHWKEIKEINQSHKLVNVYNDRVTAIK